MTMTERVDEPLRNADACQDATAASVWRLVQQHGPPSLARLLTAALGLGSRAEALTTAVETVSSELAAEARPKLAEFMQQLQLGLGELRVLRWKQEVVRRLAGLWRRMEDVREEMVGRKVSLQRVCGLCDEVVGLARDVEQLHEDTDHQLGAVGALEQKLVCLRNDLIERMQTMWKSMVHWKGSSSIHAETSNSHDALPSTDDPEGRKDFSQGDNEKTEYCPHCVELVMRRHSDQRRFVSALRSLGILGRCLELLGKTAFACLIRPFTLRQSGVRHLRLRAEPEVVVLSLQCVRCSSSVLQQSCGEGAQDGWRGVFDAGVEGAATPVDEFVRSVRCLGGVVECLHEVLLDSDIQLTRLLWSQCEPDDLSSLLADSDLLAAAVGQVNDLSDRKHVRRMLVALHDLDALLVRLGHPEGGKLKGSLFNSTEDISAPDLDPEEQDGQTVGEDVVDEKTVDDVFLNLLCNNKLASIRALLLLHETVEDDTVLIEEPPCDDSQDSGVSLEELSERIRSESPTRRSPAVDSADDEASGSSREDRHFEEESTVLPGFASLLECDVLFRFPCCLVWRSAVDIEKIVVDLSSGWSYTRPSNEADSGSRCVGELAPSAPVPLESASESISDVLSKKPSSQGCPSTDPSSDPVVTKLGSDEPRCERGEYGDSVLSLYAQRRLMLCVRQMLQLCYCLLSHRLSSQRLEDSTSSPPTPHLLRSMALTHNSCHWISYRALQTAVTAAAPRVASSCSPHVLWLSAAAELRRLAGLWLESGLHLVERTLKQAVPTSCDSCTHERLSSCTAMVRAVQGAWSPPHLPAAVSDGVLAALSGRVLEAFCEAVLREPDISATSCDRLLVLSASCEHQLPRVTGCGTQWRRFCLLREVLAAGLVDIGRLWKQEGLSECFTAEQVRQLVRALFRNTERRAVLLSTIN